jgi:hypothetical protein
MQGTAAAVGALVIGTPSLSVMGKEVQSGVYGTDSVEPEKHAIELDHNGS